MAAGKSHKFLCILVADDHEDSLGSLSRLLEINGYTVYTARTAREAKDLAAARRCDLFIGDIGLPDGSGLDLMRELRDRHGLSGIAVSGYSGKEDVAEALAAGFEKHLAKPVTFSELLAAITKLTT
jgi:DNA-binding response OmpR family regulator